MIRLARYAGAAQKLVADNSPTILTVAAVAGVVTTAFLVARAAPKAHIDIVNEQAERTDELDLTDKVLLTYKYFIPAATTGALTIACVIGANTINMKRTTALAGAYGLSELALKSYRDKVVEHIGEAKEQKVRDEVNQDLVDRLPEGKQIIIANGGNVLFLDKWSGQLFESDVETVRKAVNDINLRMIHDMYASLNDFYYILGVDQNEMGNEFGWSVDLPLELEEFTAAVRHGKPCLVIDYRVQPKRGYNKFG
jgi:hypothetical protein